ncbi:MAG: hypothetical protein JNL32_04265 [Candidatus Kapabacteria bacterium]|nr:hypothetical protein [Candidatus Kapabacteria bacterium]
MAAAVSLRAQGGSNYSIIGFGDMRQSVGAGYDGIGGSVYGVNSDYLINSINPALWGLVKNTRIQGGYRFNQIRITQGSDITSQNNGKLDGAAVLFALDTATATAASIGIFPSSSINYAFTRNISIPKDSSEGGGSIGGLSNFYGSGGLVTAYLGGTTHVTDGLHLGASALIHFGTIIDRYETTMYSESSYNSLNARRDQMTGFGGRIGAMWMSADKLLTIGGALTVNGTIRYNTTINYRTESQAGQISIDTNFLSSGSSPMPTIAGIGASYRSGKFLFAGDVEYTAMSGITYRMNDGITPGNAFRASFGISRLGVQSAGTAYFDRVAFSIGGGMRQLYFKVDGVAISEFYGSFGMQLPFGGAAMVDASINAGIRGAANLLREEFIRFNVSMSVGETWFVPFKRED